MAKSREERNSIISTAMKRRAINRTCPECKRGNALSKKQSADGFITVYRCRYCGYERVYDRLFSNGG